jgi:hypothetical protein
VGSGICQSFGERFQAGGWRLDSLLHGEGGCWVFNLSPFLESKACDESDSFPHNFYFYSFKGTLSKIRHKRHKASFPELGAFERNLPVAHLPRGG